MGAKPPHPKDGDPNPAGDMRTRGVKPQPARGVRWGAPLAWVVPLGCWVILLGGAAPNPAVPPQEKLKPGYLEQLPAKLQKLSQYLGSRQWFVRDKVGWGVLGVFGGYPGGD